MAITRGCYWRGMLPLWGAANRGSLEGCYPTTGIDKWQSSIVSRQCGITALAFMSSCYPAISVRGTDPISYASGLREFIYAEPE